MKEGSPPPSCHVSHVMWHVSQVLNLVGGGTVINEVTPSNFYVCPPKIGHYLFLVLASQIIMKIVNTSGCSLGRLGSLL